MSNSGDFYAEIRKNPEDRILKTTEILRDEAVEIWKKFHEMPDRARY